MKTKCRKFLSLIAVRTLVLFAATTFAEDTPMARRRPIFSFGYTLYLVAILALLLSRLSFFRFSENL